MSGVTNGVLSNIRILDLTRVLAGPFCTMLLADLGAQVIKVEKPNTGDETRVWGPPFISQQMSCYFAAVNRNKKSIVIDLKQKQGIQLLLCLAKKCDVLIENFVPGKLSEMGVGYEDIKKVNSSIIYASITGFGSTGPYAQRAGYDVIAASVGGLLSVTGPEDGQPCKPGVAVTDLATGLYAKSAILSALLYRQKHGKGCKIDCDLLSTQVSLLTNLGSNYVNSGAKARRRGTAHESIVPYQSFKCRDDKWITVGAGSDTMFAKLCQLIQLTEAIGDRRFENNAKRVANRDVIVEMIGERFKSKTLDQWLHILDGSGIPYGAVNELADVFADPQVVHNDCVMSATHPKLGSVHMLRNAVKYRTDDEHGLHCHHVACPPLLGEHSVHVLKSLLNYDDNQINRLLSESVIQSAGN